MNNSTPWVEDILPPAYETVSDECRSSDRTLESYLIQLRANPGRRLAWSWHQSRGAARQRINNLRRTQMFRNSPDVQFETRSVQPGNPERGVYILIYSDRTAGEQEN